MQHKITSFEQYKETYQKSIEDPEQFWSDIADTFQWKQKWNKVLEWNFEEHPRGFGNVAQMQRFNRHAIGTGSHHQPVACVVVRT